MTAHVTYKLEWDKKNKRIIEYQKEFTPPEVLTEWELYGHDESGELHLFAVGGTEEDGFSDNWDIYAAANGRLFSIARSGSGARGTQFGDCRHIKNLMRQGHWRDTLTPYGVELMKGA